MKKTVALLFPLLIIITLFCSCRESETTNAKTFSERYAALCDYPFSFSDIIASEDSSGLKYTFTDQKNDGGKKILVTLLENESRKLFECRITAAKSDEKNNAGFSSADRDRYFSVCLKTLCAFSNFDEEKARDVLIKLGTDKEEAFKTNGEKTLKADEYYLVALGNDVAAEVIIYNTYLKKIEETEKPESKPIFDETTKIRTQTVPHK